MDLKEIFIVTFLIGLLIVVFVKSKKFKQKLKASFLIASKVLQSELKTGFGGSLVGVEGRYKGREIKFLFEGVGRGGRLIRLSIIPQNISKKVNILSWKIFKPTPKTIMNPKRILYWDQDLMRRINNEGLPEFHSEQEFISILEELTKAAEIVESGAPYFKE